MTARKHTVKNNKAYQPDGDDDNSELSTKVPCKKCKPNPRKGDFLQGNPAPS